IDLARPEKGVRCRESGNGSTRPLRGHKSVGRSKRNDVRLHVAKRVVLPAVRKIAPNHVRTLLNRKPLKSRVVLVGHRWTISPGNDFLPDEICPLVDRVLQPSLEHAKLHSGE